MPTVVKFALLIIGAALLALTARTLLVNKMQPQASEEEPRASIMLAATDLPAGLLLRSENIEWQSRPNSQVPFGAVSQESAEADTPSGVLLRHGVRAGEAILARNVIRHDAPGFLAAALQPNMRAISVPVDPVSGNAGLIQPGDYVDIILVQQSRSNELIDKSRARSVVSETVVENVRVIAVDSIFQEEKENTLGNSHPRQPVRTVTLEVMPRVAEAVAVASRLGSLTLALRSFAVTDPMARQQEPTGTIVAWSADSDHHQPTWASDVSRAIKPLPAPAPAAPSIDATPAATTPRSIVIMRGGERNILTLETEAGF